MQVWHFVETRLGLSALHALYAKFPQLTVLAPDRQQLRWKSTCLHYLESSTYLQRAFLHQT